MELEIKEEIDFARSPEREALDKLCRELKPGQEMTYAEMSARVQFDVLDYLGCLYRVRDCLKREGTAVIDTIAPRVGIRRLTDTEVVNMHAARYLKKTRNAAGRGKRGNESVDYAALTPADQTTHNARQAMFGALKMFSSGRAQKKLALEIPKSRPELPSAKVLDLFRK